MATSTISTMKQNLVTQLTARAGLSGVQITNGPPLPSPQREYIWVGTAEGDQSFATFAAPNQRLEEYDVTINISVKREGTDTNLAVTEARCFALFGELETQVRTDPTVNGAVTVAEVGHFRLGEFVAPDGMNREVQIAADVHCRAYI